MEVAASAKKGKIDKVDMTFVVVYEDLNGGQVEGLDEGKAKNERSKFTIESGRIVGKEGTGNVKWRDGWCVDKGSSSGIKFHPKSLLVSIFPILWGVEQQIETHRSMG